MAVLKCEMCGGNLIFNKGDKFAVCESCGTKQSVFYFNDKKEASNRFTIIQKSDYYVNIKELTENEIFKNCKSDLTFALGKDYQGNMLYADINELQHILITGVSGFGKTNFIRSILYSLIYKSIENMNIGLPKFLIIDPKGVDYADFADVCNLLVPIVKVPGKASGALGWLVSETLRRLQLFSDIGVKDISSYNEYIREQKDKENEDKKELPEIITFIDDFNNICFSSQREIEDSVLRILQLGRICGVHLIISSQQADRKFLPDKIKNAIPTKISFALRSKSEAKYIFDCSCAEHLTSVGDMLYYPISSNRIIQIKACCVEDDDVQKLVNRLHNLSESIFNDEKEDSVENSKEIEGRSPGKNDFSLNDKKTWDPLFEKAVDTVIENGRASTSFLQRMLGVGYSRGAKIMEQLEEAGIIGPQSGAMPREILISKEGWLKLKGIYDNDTKTNIIDDCEKKESAENDKSKIKLSKEDYKKFEDLLRDIEEVNKKNDVNIPLDKTSPEKHDSKELPSEITKTENKDKSESKNRSLRNIFNNKKVEKKEDFETDLKKANNKIKKKKRKVFSLKHGGTIVLSVGILLFAIGFLLINKTNAFVIGGNQKLGTVTAIITLLSFVFILVGLILIKRKHENKFRISKAEKELNKALSDKDILLRKNYKK